MVGLGFLEALGVSGDGSIIVGRHSGAVIWDAAHGVRDVKTVIETSCPITLNGWFLSSAQAISDDGQTIVGLGTDPNGFTEAWLARIPNGSVAEPAGDVQSLRVRAFDSGEIELTWGPSCLTTDTDYAVYEGQLGDFTSHTPRLCSTAMSTTTTLTPASSDAYYLVVPANAHREGSYGRGSTGAERSQGQAPCMPQLLGSCP